ncbi:RNA-binding S4 domain-containing protein [Vibrio alfacsensis]|uniref:RNA-binding S4 domain-containing protein n=1 Tax=Vibrio alfacsensis TaxID=1074311 RepID=A0ABN5PKQ3_9VIBR|nr:RNA-binding S4 domain-containing protein [Vibrio alfacsensis]AXY02962.1 RNA-binding S4 domain-containing protein [Vibrio alfacsensis]
MTQDYEQEEYLDGEEIEIEAIGIDVDAHPIELYKLFKIANLVSGGGEAKHIIEEGYVAVNGELEIRKRRKMYDGDFFEFNQEYYVVVCDAPVTEPETAEQKAEKKAKKEAQTARKQKPRKEKPRNEKQPNVKGTGPKSTGRKAAHKERKAQKEALSQSAKKGKKADKPQATRDPNSGRNSIDFF